MISPSASALPTPSDMVRVSAPAAITCLLPINMVLPGPRVSARRTVMTGSEGTVPRSRLVDSNRRRISGRDVEIRHPDFGVHRTGVPREVHVALAGIDERLPGPERSTGARRVVSRIE